MLYCISSKPVKTYFENRRKLNLLAVQPDDVINANNRTEAIDEIAEDVRIILSIVTIN